MTFCWSSACACIISTAASSPSAVICLRSSFKSANSVARMIADSFWSANNNFKERTAVSNLPLALMQGPNTNPRWYALRRSACTSFCCIRACNPKFLVWRICSKPYFTMILFSSIRSITSPTVANAAFSKNTMASSAGILHASYNAWMTFHATTAPQIPANG